MAPFLSLALAMILLGTARAESDENRSPEVMACADACSDYSRWTYDCAQRAGCFSPDIVAEGFNACWAPCDAPTTQCHELCFDNYEDVLDKCDETCEDKWMIDIYCEDRCFKREFQAQYQSQLPPLTSHDVGLWDSLFGGDEDEVEVDDK